MNTWKIINFIKRHKLLDMYIPSKAYLKLLYYHHTGKKLNINNPSNFNEKIQWLKLYNKDKRLTLMADKYKVRKEVANIIGEEYLIPLIGVYDSVHDIDFSSLPKQFVKKCNHDSGSYIICKNKDDLNIEEVREKINAHMNYNFYYSSREWSYKNIERKIIIEKYIEDKKTNSFDDYKFMCFDGYVESVMVCLERHTGNTKFYFFDKNLFGSMIDLSRSHYEK